MNNEIVLRTSKGEYHLESAVCGAVYLNICRPTEANGIRITFKGGEKCCYEYEDDDGKKKQLKSESTHVDFSDVTLFSQNGYFDLGRYVFPFRFQLPKDIPGSFKCSGQTAKSSWSATVSYSIKACAIGAEDIQVIQPLVIYEAELEDLKQGQFTSAKDSSFEVSGFLPRMRKRVHVTAKLLDNYVECGSNVQLRLIITNPSKVKLTGFSIKLIRYLTLHMRDAPPCVKASGNMQFMNDACQISPESGPLVVRTVSGNSETIIIGNGGLDKLQLPLAENVPEGTRDVSPSVTGKHVKNQYGVEVAVTFSNDHTESFTLPISGVLPRTNTNWSRWRAPDWTFHCETKLSSCIFSVTEQMLRTEAFSGLPMFQVL
ncbi:arrestin domain-containing protein A isoform X2 [Aplysia californica]|uniref:Arrestin domain-containing protein A isoform X2 n=1 Tax=Aplysia californica TaxID=6500 RepID=A0ABM0JD77_APLCA|nr:arrestin domain-containing protein A isoform X2 [Aplysia californica]